MLKQRLSAIWRREAGDTLIEVTFALAILSAVLLSSTVIAMTAFRTGQTARERTQISQQAQQQMEALRSFRDNHSWTEFRVGASPAYHGIDGVLGSNCVLDVTVPCFHMELKNTSGVTWEWVPVAGVMTGSVPTSQIGITTQSNAASVCGYDFVLHYSFTPLGGNGIARNQIATRLVNLQYGGVGPCPVH